MGFDTAGEPFLSGDRVLRGIYPGEAATVRRVLKSCQENDLFRHGIVATRELPENPHPEFHYELVLEHDRIQFITYPHEWSASMFKEAALLHIALYERLHEHGLTLKDWHPHNILFDGTRPVFVDFTSIVPIEDLPKQPHLLSGKPPLGMTRSWDPTAKAVYEMYRLMYEPYFGLPLAMMHRGMHAQARRRMYETTLNAGDSVITRREVFGDSVTGRFVYEMDERFLHGALIEKGTRKSRFFHLLRRTIASRRAALTGSAYSSYYEEKGEAFASTPDAAWTNKQHGVYSALTRFRPRSVLDLGSNTGWFSMLAASLGSSVIAVDLDEASIDRLFLDASHAGLDVLPLVANLTDPLPALRARTYEHEPSRSLIGEDAPVVSPPNERLRCDMVMALALVHHLALGQGMSFGQIAAVFAGLATKYLCVEFVGIDDAMITSDPGFFPAYHRAAGSFGWYTRPNFVAALKEHFGEIEILPSHPESRGLIVCSKRVAENRTPIMET